jgi:hypothetical protein
MVPQEFFRRASMAALVIVATGVMACGERKGAHDGVLPGSESAAGGMAGSNAAPTPALTPETQQAIDAGNAAYRAKDYANALTEFEKAAARSPQLAAPWFGIYMVAQVRKDTKAADAALAEIRKRGDAPAMAGTKTGTGVTKN